jgi:hypothetical protein
MNRLMGPIYRSRITLLEQSSQGGFMWCYQNLNQQFNEGTLDFIGANVIPGSAPGMARLSSAGSFQNAWAQLLTGLIYSLSSDDTVRLNRTVLAAQVHAQQVVTDYVAIFGSVNDAARAAARAALPSANIQNSFDYITAYVMGYLWSGASRTKAAPLTPRQMSNSSGLLSLLPGAPLSARPLVATTAQTFALQQRAQLITAQQEQGHWILTQMLANLTTPTEANGGMQTVNPNTGAVSEAFQPAYSAAASISAIENDLSNDTRVLRISMPMAPNAAGSQVRFAAAQGEAAETRITIEYRGYCLVPVGPQPWQQASNRGWYSSDPVVQAVNNGSRDVTGFHFVSPSPFRLTNIDNGGNVGFISAVLISNSPTVTVHYDNTDPAAVKRTLPDNQTGTLELFGSLTFGNAVSGGYCADCRASGSSAGADVVFSPSKELQTVPQLQRSAYVIGAVISNPVG